MTVAASESSAVSLSCRAGKTLTFDITVYDQSPSRREVDLTTYTGRLQIRDLRSRQRVLINSAESTEINAPLQRLSKGRWRIFLGKSYTSWLPMLSRIEVEIVNTTMADDVLPILNGTLRVTPEGVAGP